MAGASVPATPLSRALEADVSPSQSSGTVRRLARELALLGASHSSERAERFKVDVARLTAGLNPESTDPEAKFLFGASLALSAALNALYEQGSL